MANYYATGRTNYFAVKDITAFEAEINALETGLEISTREKDGQTLLALISQNEGGFVWTAYTDETGNHEEIDWSMVFTKHLQDGWVAIIIESGAEALRYVDGTAMAFNSKGEEIVINLVDEITKRAESLGSHITEPSY